MGLFDLFRRRPPLRLAHPELGELEFDARLQCWQRDGFEFWGRNDVTLVLDASPAGPTDAQVAEVRRLAAARDELLPRCLAALRPVADDIDIDPQFVVEYLHVPSLDGTPRGELANLGFDLVGDEHYIYGVQTTDRWRTLQAHRDD